MATSPPGLISPYSLYMHTTPIPSQSQQSQSLLDHLQALLLLGLTKMVRWFYMRMFVCNHCCKYNVSVPSAPAQAVNVTIVSFEEVTIEWQAPNQADQNGIITGYLVNITLVSTGMSFTRSSTSTSLTLNGLQPFTSYTCHVAAQTQVGPGPFSMPITFLTDETGKSPLARFMRQSL